VVGSFDLSSTWYPRQNTWITQFCTQCLTIGVNWLTQDPDAKKPDDWDEREKIDDPDDSKPEDWDKPEHIPDPDAKKPDDWDDEMDGEWEPPMIDNPEYKVQGSRLNCTKKLDVYIQGR